MRSRIVPAADGAAVQWLSPARVLECQSPLRVAELPLPLGAQTEVGGGSPQCALSGTPHPAGTSSEANWCGSLKWCSAAAGSVAAGWSYP